MNTTIDPAVQRAETLFEQLEERWRTLGLPLWKVGADSAIQRSSLTESCRAMLEASGVIPIMDELLALPGKSNPETRELKPGCWLIEAAVPFGGKRGGRIATIVFTESFLQSLPIRPAGEKSQTCTPEQVSGIAATFAWTVKDLAARMTDGATLQQYGERLAQAYEETNLLFRMARLLNMTDDPYVVLQAISTQIHQIFPFQWMCIQFADLPSVLDVFRGETLFAGSPVQPERIRHAATSIFREFRGQDTWTRILQPTNNGYAGLLGTELVVEPIVHDGKPVGILLAGDKQGDDPAVSSFEMQFLDAAADFLGVFHENASRFSEQRRLFIGTLRALTASIDAKDHYTRGHSDRVSLLAELMARGLSLSPHEIERFRIAGLVHDVGKIGVPEAVLCKPGKLTDEEFELIKQHPTIGHEILKDIPAMSDVLPGVLSHHEKWNGKGYPRGIAGEEIPLVARVLALCDTFDAMSSSRSYRSAIPQQKVIEELHRCAGSQFDPALVPVFTSLDFTTYYERLRGGQVASLAA
jgi:HD-GYP domain-containing protein (c-di-GMP phosphodiesterase class II)